jgi:hypothetical protein
MFHLFRTYVAANILCCKCFMSRGGKRAQAKVVPPRAQVRSSPHVSMESKADVTANTEHKVVPMGVVAGVEHEAIFIDGQQT